MSARAFDSIADFVLHLEALERGSRHRLRSGLERALVIVENDAKRQIGHYQPEASSFPAWAPLADSTESEKARLGYPTSAPLLRTGEMRESFSHAVESDTEGVVGSTDPTMVFHEFGTRKMPPRPVLGPAVFNNRARIEKILGRAMLEGIIGGEIASDGDYFGGDIG